MIKMKTDYLNLVYMHFSFRQLAIHPHQLCFINFIHPNSYQIHHNNNYNHLKSTYVTPITPKQLSSLCSITLPLPLHHPKPIHHALLQHIMHLPSLFHPVIVQRLRHVYPTKHRIPRPCSLPQPYQILLPHRLKPTVKHLHLQLDCALIVHVVHTQLAHRKTCPFKLLLSH